MPLRLRGTGKSAHTTMRPSSPPQSISKRGRNHRNWGQRESHRHHVRQNMQPTLDGYRNPNKVFRCNSNRPQTPLEPTRRTLTRGNRSERPSRCTIRYSRAYRRPPGSRHMGSHRAKQAHQFTRWTCRSENGPWLAHLWRQHRRRGTLLSSATVLHRQ